jgi:hypothetical protein
VVKWSHWTAPVAETLSPMQKFATDCSEPWLPEPQQLRTRYLADVRFGSLLARRAQSCVEVFVNNLPALEDEIRQGNLSEAADSLRCLLATSGLRNAWRIAFNSLHAGIEFCIKLESLAESLTQAHDVERCLRLAHELRAWGRQTRLPAE